MFVNRKTELLELNRLWAKGGLVILFGRRRVGKTALLNRWISEKQVLYSQAIEGTKELQLDQILSDLKQNLQSPIEPKSWPELFSAISQIKGRTAFCLDEFPYLVASDSSLPSRLQKWLDQEKKRDLLVILAGSGEHMMHELFLNPAAPLYGRATRLLRIDPMKYSYFCKAVGLSRGDPASFTRFALVGGIPKYWQWVERSVDPVRLADRLYFEPSALLEREPRQLLSDEKVEGLWPLSVLEAVGRGATKPSEIASRLRTPQTNLSRTLEALVDASILERQSPFGESPRSTKRVVYGIRDPVLRFWYHVYSPHRSRWHVLKRHEKEVLLRLHTSAAFESYYRRLFPAAGRYWETGLELDCVRLERSPRTLVVSEVKWARLGKRERENVEKQVRQGFMHSSLAARYRLRRVEVVDQTVLKEDLFV